MRRAPARAPSTTLQPPPVALARAAAPRAAHGLFRLRARRPARGGCAAPRGAWRARVWPFLRSSWACLPFGRRPSWPASSVPPALAAGVAGVGAAQLIQDRRILKRRDVLGDLLAARHGFQQASHDLARARLGEIVGKADFIGLGDGTDLLGHPVAQLLDQRAGVARSGARRAARRRRIPTRP